MVVPKIRPILTLIIPIEREYFVPYIILLNISLPNLSVMQLEYIEAIHSIGGSNIRVILKHILPNISAPITILATLQVGNAILVGSGLSFLGMGAQPPTPEWGLMTAEGRSFMSQAWWISTFPGIAILITVISINQFGDGLREAIVYLAEIS